jgi:phosphoribosylformylglycinamidine synthase
MVIAYSDNASVMEGHEVERFVARGYQPGCTTAPQLRRPVNRADAACADEGGDPQPPDGDLAVSRCASTGAGGEIRDEGATGRGSRPKAGLTWFHRVQPACPGDQMPGKRCYGKPEHIASPLQIMIEGPLGRGRLQQRIRPAQPAGLLSANTSRLVPVSDTVRRGYHKPIMIAGGLGTIDASITHKIEFPAGSAADPAGWPGMRIGMGGSARQSMAHGHQLGRAGLRLGAAWQPRDRAPRAGGHQPLLGAGREQSRPGHPRRGRRRPLQRVSGTGGARCRRGARFDLRAVPLEESGMAPKEIWCNESQERYVLAIARGLPASPSICPARALPVCGGRRGHRRAPAPAARPSQRSDNYPVDMPMEVLLGKPPKMHRDVAACRRA